MNVTVLKNNTNVVVGAEVIVDGKTLMSDANGTAYHDNSGNKYRIGTTVLIKVKASGCFAKEKTITFALGDDLVRKETFALNPESNIIPVK